MPKIVGRKVGAAALWPLSIPMIASGPHQRVGPRPPGRLYKPNGERECARRRKQRADRNQLWSHYYSPGSVYPQMVWPAHLGERVLFMADVTMVTAGFDPTQRDADDPWQWDRVRRMARERDMKGFFATLSAL